MALWNRRQSSLVNLPQVEDSQTRQRADLTSIALPNRARGMAFGMTGSGKSVLTQHLMEDWRRRYPATARILIVDSKPNYRALWRLNGTNARGEYKRMEKEPPVADSVLLPLARHGELRQVWEQGHHVAIAQIPNLGYIGALEAIMSEFYAKGDAKYHQLVLVDEGADFFASNGAFSRSHSLMQIVRSGRKRGVSLLFCSQAPRNLPSSILSERTNLYVFKLALDADRKRLEDASLPPSFSIPTHKYDFYYHGHDDDRAGIYRLALPEAA